MEYPASRRDGSRKKRINPLWRQLAVILVPVVLWAGLLYGAYYYATDYINKVVRHVEQTNALQVQVLEDRLDAIQFELAQMKEALADADQVLARSEQTREALHQRINDLDRQLERLEESLNVLRKSPDVSR